MARSCCGGPVCACKIVAGGGGITITGTGTSQDPFVVTASGTGGGGGGGPTPVDTTPPGSVIQGFWVAAPDGYALVTGSTGVVLNRAANPVLYALFGVRFNIGGETSLQFRLPTAAGKVLVTRDPTQTEFDVLGESGGAKTVTLTVAQLPEHRHGLGGFSWYWGAGQGDTHASADALFGPAPAGSNNLFTKNDWNISDKAGGSQPHNNLPPYLVVNTAIKLG